MKPFLVSKESQDKVQSVTCEKFKMQEVEWHLSLPLPKASIKKLIWRRRAALVTTNMETLYWPPFLVLEWPNLKLKKPSCMHMSSAMTMYTLVVVVLLPHHQRNRVLALRLRNMALETSSFLGLQSKRTMYYRRTRILFTLGGLGFINLDQSKCTKHSKTQ